MTTALRLLLEVGQNWRRHAGLLLTTLIVLTAGFATLLCLAVGAQNIARVLTLWGESNQISVFFADDVTTDKISAVAKWLGDSESFSKTEIVDTEKAVAAFRKQIEKTAPDLVNDPDLAKFVPTSVQATLAPGVPTGRQLQALQGAERALSQFAGVSSVSYGQDWIREYADAVHGVQSLGFILGGMALVAATLIMGHTVSRSVQNRRQEVAVLELVGATSAYIRAPFLTEGAVLGFASTLLGLVIVRGLFSIVQTAMQTNPSFASVAAVMEFLSPLGCAIALVAGTGLGALSAWLSVRQINSGWAASETN